MAHAIPVPPDVPFVPIDTLVDLSGNPCVAITPNETANQAADQASINTEAIQEYFRKLGSDEGDTRPLTCLGKLYGLNDTIVDGGTTSPSHFSGGGGICIFGGGGHYHQTTALNQIRYDADATSGQKMMCGGGFVWMGNPNNSYAAYTDRPMFHLRGAGNVFDTLNLYGWRHATTYPRFPVRPQLMIDSLFHMEYDESIPTGKNMFNNMAMNFANKGWKFTGENNADNTVFTGIMITAGVIRLLAGDSNDQAVGFWLEFIKASGPFDPIRICSFDEGGRVHIGNLKMTCAGTIVETYTASNFYSDFVVDDLWWDRDSIQGDVDYTLGPVYPTIQFNQDGFTTSATCNGTTTLTLGALMGLTAHVEDIGLKLIITGGNGFALRGHTNPLTITGATTGGSTWTLDAVPTASTFTADTATNILTFTGEGHTLATGTVVRVSSTTGLPIPLLTATDYYVIAINSTSCKLATSASNATNNIPIDITDIAPVGSGTLTLTAQSATGLVGQAGPHVLNKLVKQHAVGAMTARIQGTMSLDGDYEGTANMVDLMDGITVKPALISLDIWNLHRATSRCYPGHRTLRYDEPFAIPSTCFFFADVQDAWEDGNMNYGGPLSTHGALNAVGVTTINDQSIYANHLSSFNTSPKFYNWGMRNKGCIVHNSGEGLRKNSTSTFTVDTATDVVTHGGYLATGNIVQVSSTTTLPAGLSAATNYYVIRISNTTCKLATSLANALAGTAIDITTTGTGTHTITSTTIPTLSDLSLSGVIRRTSTGSGNRSLMAVWENSQACFSLGLNSSHQFVLYLSSTGSHTVITSTATLTSYVLPVNVNVGFCIVWDGTAGTVTLYAEGTTQVVTGITTSNLFASTAPLTVGCQSSGGSINNPMMAAWGIMMAESTALSVAQVDYRLEEFAARRGTFLNPALV